MVQPIESNPISSQLEPLKKDEWLSKEQIQSIL